MELLQVGPSPDLNNRPAGKHSWDSIAVILKREAGYLCLLLDCTFCALQLMLSNLCWVKSLQKCQEPEGTAQTIMSLFSTVFLLQT